MIIFCALDDVPLKESFFVTSKIFCSLFTIISIRCSLFCCGAEDFDQRLELDEF